jgi:hypothetical protein
MKRIRVHCCLHKNALMRKFGMFKVDDAAAAADDDDDWKINK